MLRHPDGADEVDGEEEEECGGAGPDNDDDDGQGLDPQEVEISIPNETFIPNRNNDNQQTANITRSTLHTY